MNGEKAELLILDRVTQYALHDQDQYKHCISQGQVTVTQISMQNLQSKPGSI